MLLAPSVSWPIGSQRWSGLAKRQAAQRDDRLDGDITRLYDAAKRAELGGAKEDDLFMAHAKPSG
eukprot:4746055-Amphidinium_carterae.1